MTALVPGILRGKRENRLWASTQLLLTLKVAVLSPSPVGCWQRAWFCSLLPGRNPVWGFVHGCLMR